MESPRFTRRILIGRAAASAAAVGVALESASTASAQRPDGDLVVGRFVSARDARTAMISGEDARTIEVTLDSSAFVAHGDDEDAASIEAFVPGEEVVARGTLAGQRMVALEFQSVYTNKTGTIAPNGVALLLTTDSGENVRVPKKVARLHAPGGIRQGARYSATVWTHPVTREATAVELSVEG